MPGFARQDALIELALRRGLNTSVSAGPYQTTWYIDHAGDPKDDGKTPATAIPYWSFRERLAGANGKIAFTENVTVFFESLHEPDPIVLAYERDGVHIVRHICKTSRIAGPFTVTAVADTNADGLSITAGGVDMTSFTGKTLHFLTGAAAGSVTYPMLQEGAGKVRIKSPFFWDGTGAPYVANTRTPVVNDTFEILDQTLFDHLQYDISGGFSQNAAYTLENATVTQFRAPNEALIPINCRFGDGGAFVATLFCAGALTASGCLFTGTVVVAPGGGLSAPQPGWLNAFFVNEGYYSTDERSTYQATTVWNVGPASRADFHDNIHEFFDADTPIHQIVGAKGGAQYAALRFNVFGACCVWIDAVSTFTTTSVAPAEWAPPGAGYVMDVLFMGASSLFTHDPDTGASSGMAKLSTTFAHLRAAYGAGTGFGGYVQDPATGATFATLTAFGF